MQVLLSPFIVIMVIVLFSNAFINNSYTHTYILKKLNQSIEPYVDINLDFKAVKLNLMSLKIDFFGLELNSSKSHENLLAISHASTGISPSNLLLGRFQLAELVIQTMAIKPDKIVDAIKKNPAASTEPLNWPPKFALPVKKVKINNFSTSLGMTYVDEPGTISLEQADISVQLDSWDYITAFLNTPAFAVNTESTILMEPSKLEAEMTFDGSKITFPDCKISNKRVNLVASGSSNIIKNGHLNTAIQTTAKVQFSGNLSLLGGFLDLEQTSGNVAGKVSLKFNTGDKKKNATFRILGDAAVEDGWLYGFSLMDSTVQFEINPDRMKFKNIALKESGVNYGQAEGEIFFDSKTSYDFKISPEKLQLSHLLSLLGADFQEFDFDLTATDLNLKGTGYPFKMKVEGAAKFGEMRFPNFPSRENYQPKNPSCDYQIDFSINSEKMNILNNIGLCEKSIRSRIDGPIYFSDRGLDLDVRFEGENLNLFSAWARAPVLGDGVIETKIIGPYDQVFIKNNLDLKNASFDDIPLSDIKGRIDYDIQRSLLEWKEIEGREKSIKYKFNNGHLNLNNMDMASDIFLSFIAKETLDKVFSIIGMNSEFSSEIQRLEGTIAGKLDTPGTWNGTGMIELSGGYIKNEKIFDQFTCQYNFQPSLKNIGEFKIFNGGLELNGSGQLLKKGSLTGSLASIGFSDHDEVKLEFTTAKKFTTKPINNLTLQDLPFAGSYLKEIQTDGDLEVKASVSGPLSKLVATSEMNIKNLSLFTSPMPPLKIQASMIDSTIDANGLLGSNDNYIRLKMKPWEKNIPYELKWNSRQLDLRFLLPEKYQRDPRNFLQFSGFLDSSGELADFFNSKALVELQQIRYSLLSSSGQAIRSTSKLNETLILNKKKLTTKSGKQIDLQAPGLNISISSGNTVLPDNLDLRYTGDIDLNSLKYFIPEIETASGKIIFNGKMLGTLTHPVPNISIESDSTPESNATLGIAGLRPPITNIKVKASLDSKKATLSYFSADKGPGFIKASGDFSWDGSPSQGINAQFTEAALIRSIPYLKDFDSLLSGQLQFQPLLDKLRVSGDINIVRARLNHEFDIRNEILSALKNVSAQKIDLKQTEAIEFDLGVRSEDGITVSNRNMDLVISSDIRLTGTDIEPKIIGLFEIKQGKFKYRSDYKIQKGLIVFDPSHGADPSLDINATSEIDNRLVEVQVSGRGSEPLIGLTVDPPIKEDGSPITETDALLLVTTGSMPRTGQSLSDTSLKSGGLNIIAGQFEKPVERLFDMTGQKIIKEVYLDSYPSNKTGSPLFRANASLQLADKLDFIIQTDQEQTGFSAEYPLDTHVNSSLNYSKSSVSQSTENSSSDFGASFDLRFRFQFP